MRRSRAVGFEKERGVESCVIRFKRVESTKEEGYQKEEFD